jgi:hypothetical protein
MQYLLNVAIALDQLANAILFSGPDETLSSRAYRADRDGKAFRRSFSGQSSTPDLLLARHGTAFSRIWPR